MGQSWMMWSTQFGIINAGDELHKPISDRKQRARSLTNVVVTDDMPEVV